MQLLGWTWTCLCVAASVALLPTAEATRVQLRGGGYEGVVVAISPEVPESQKLVEAIKHKIKDASGLLFNASRKTVFFKKVTILLPGTWEDTNPDSYNGNISYEESDIRVAPASHVYGHQPYTEQPGGCGRPGKFSHFTPEFLTDENLSYVWGPPERLMVFEWAKLRWGVYEEIGYRGDDQFPPNYPRYFDGEDDQDGDGEREEDDDGEREEDDGDDDGEREEDDGDDDGERENSARGKNIYRVKEVRKNPAGKMARGKREAPAEREARLTANLCVVGNLEGRYVDSQTGESCSRREEKCDFLVKEFRANLWSVSLDEDARRGRDVAFCDDEEKCDFLVKEFRANLWPVSLDEDARRGRDVAFCDDEEDSTYRHNNQAPNKHNLRCKGESWWAVMRRHPDFKDTPSSQNAPEETQFEVIQLVDARVVMVLDLTQPETANDSLAFARRWLYEGAGAGSYVGVLLILPGVKNVVHVTDMTRITLSSRLEILNSLEEKAYSARDKESSNPAASVRKGVEEASKMFNNTDINAAILLVNNNEIQKKDLLDFPADLTTPVYTISSVASSGLKEYVEKTKGKFVVLEGPLDEGKQKELVADVSNYVSQPGGPRNEAPISFQNETIWGKTEGSSVPIDGIPGTYIFRLSTNNPNHVLEPPTVALQHSPGKVYQAKQQAGSSLNQWTVVVDDASTKEPGAWVWRVNTTDDANSFVRLETLLEPEADQGPVVQVDSWIEQVSGPDGVAGTSDEVLLYAKVMEGEMPVLGAVVEAYVSSAENSSIKHRLQLYDTGSGADSQKGDGLYSCSVPPFAKGNYSIEVKVSSNDGTKVPQAFPKGSLRRPRRMCCGSSFPSSTKTRPVPYLNRGSHAGTFTSNYNLREDRIAPFRVTDLRKKGMALIGNRVCVQLAWTATGDDRDFGQASRYTVRGSPSRGSVQAETCAGSCKKLTPVFEAGAASPPAGQRMTARVFLPNDGHAHFFFAVIAQDEVGNASPLSNVVAVEVRGSLFQEWRLWAQILQWLLIGVLAAVGLAIPLLLACDRRQRRFLWLDEIPLRKL
ncbi:calcium-activated chloride channel regulator 1-like isoform X2 [Penaeus indicus]|uniref:calcium-activated chloride channel regulator 1-like isoform X2 n=1 Tax=Penaeus indicus TaxID=29960 RepID=UPI00300D77B6